MLYAIIGEDVADSLEKRKRARDKHIDRLRQLQDEGRMVLAGPNPKIDSEDPGPAGFTGSIIIAEFDSLEAAREWANADPYLEAGVYASVTVKPFKRVFPA